ncbi:hypothetical protein CspeluHIS016_0900090 [Cutaneotrichosporon spelunceum]|uniref:Mif2/CENP-C cupin domain-containing protein n=1 Tax=Cutaneotrichosporon spelunceum TaxID=1672016 RepID=A0AAD3TZQ5_9TREE|nr:hypothetical protein CspeluHIS016_0900090 [Cutaneotrichosporon spelunceum]
MPPRGPPRRSGRPTTPATPRARAPSTPRGQQKYVPYNTQPDQVGTRTGMVMKADVPRNEEGIEDPEAFFHSSPPTAPVPATPNGRGFPTSSPPAPPPPSTLRQRRRPRLSDMNDDSDSDTGSLAADGLLDDDFEQENITPPPLLHQSSPNPPASVRQRRSGMDDDDNPFRPVPVEHSGRTNGLNSGVRDAGVDMDDLNAAFDTNDLEAEVTEQLQDTHLGEVDEDSQPVRARRQSEHLKGPLPPSSDGVPDSIVTTRDAEPMDDGSHNDIGEPFEDNGPLDAGDHSDVGKPFSDNESLDAGGPSDVGEPFAEIEPEPEPEPMDLGNDEPQLSDQDDDVDLEQQVTAYENAEGDLYEEDDSLEYPKRGTKRTSNATPHKKVKRKSQFGGEGGNQYVGDFVCRRSGRHHIKPLEWWRGERKEYEKGEFGPEVISIVRVPETVVVKPRATTRRGRGRGRGRSQTGRLQSASAAPPEVPAGLEHLDIDRNIETMVAVKDYTTGDDVVRKTFLPHAFIEPKPVRGGSFYYQKAFGEDGFIAGGVVMIPPGGEKPAKPSGDNAYIFYVSAGAVEVNIAGNITPLGPQSMFMVPRGNNYSISNKFQQPATLVFSQGRKISQNEEERTRFLAKQADERRALRQERERDRVELDPEDFETKWADWDDGVRVVDDLSSEHEDDDEGLRFVTP